MTPDHEALIFQLLQTSAEDTLCHEAAADLRDLDAQAEAMAAALEPFAALADAIDREAQERSRREDEFAFWSADAFCANPLDLTVGKMRDARSALAAYRAGQAQMLSPVASDQPAETTATEQAGGAANAATGRSPMDLQRENDTLRAMIAKGPMDCVYCGLPAADMNKCASGFPGCGRADDMMADPRPEPPAPAQAEASGTKKPSAMTKKWCENMAKLEGDDEVGAGALAADPWSPLASCPTPHPPEVIAEMDAEIRALPDVVKALTAIRAFVQDEFDVALVGSHRTLDSEDRGIIKKAQDCLDRIDVVLHRLSGSAKN